MYFRYLHDYVSIYNPYGTFPNLGGAVPVDPDLRFRPGYNLQLSWTYVIRPNLVNEARINADWHSQRTPVQGTAWMKSTYGFDFIPPLGAPTQFPDGLPTIQFTSVPAFPTSAPAPVNGPAPNFLIAPTTDINPVDNVSWTKHNHAFKFGAEFARNRKTQNSRTTYDGTLSFSPTAGATSAANCVVSGKPMRYERRPAPVLATVTVAAWCLAMYAGSRTAADGFPQRFERDLGAALGVVAALGLGVLLKTAWLAWQTSRQGKVVPVTVLSLALAVPVVLAIGVPSAREAGTESRPARLLSAPVVAAGAWLRDHNSGGTIVATPMNHGITERSVLALGDYTGLMYYSPGVSFTKARSLPPAGVRPLIDSQEVLEHPASCAAEQAIAREDVRFVVVYRKTGHDSEANEAGFQADPARYRPVFENQSVVIYAPQVGPAPVRPRSRPLGCSHRDGADPGRADPGRADPHRTGPRRVAYL